MKCMVYKLYLNKAIKKYNLKLYKGKFYLHNHCERFQHASYNFIVRYRAKYCI